MEALSAQFGVGFVEPRASPAERKKSFDTVPGYAAGWAQGVGAICVQCTQSAAQPWLRAPLPPPQLGGAVQRAPRPPPREGAWPWLRRLPPASMIGSFRFAIRWVGGRAQSLITDGCDKDLAECCKELLRLSGVEASLLQARVLRAPDRT